ncbi:Hypothetical Protein MfeM64YM_0949 [Mycoplasmopsis fermentans M64]|uniref:Uncharacterized protein n=1 Tax=Mycoplasmopsis fermentans (strain M64) TaxID=943945 RepID=A0AB32XCU7_MYCFM|nr:Hypothetical Protein MfeM64YM_0949 [Mycoplasmopsis fermentans M64]
MKIKFELFFLWELSFEIGPLAVFNAKNITKAIVINCINNVTPVLNHYIKNLKQHMV